ncbi:hypothetical protein SAMN05444354_1061 [Stigmatella aurantiaca]|uniref:Uncharacterized protein n=1 Tax=Stigmatella aurantiaca TaxID=41 RepID=A0A1H7Q4F1_STIAU|nr:hypothetical protein SAMN05444354_1061 [Stigmatella aurantiaca]
MPFGVGTNPTRMLYPQGAQVLIKEGLLTLSPYAVPDDA